MDNFVDSLWCQWIKAFEPSPGLCCSRHSIPTWAGENLPFLNRNSLLWLTACTFVTPSFSGLTGNDAAWHECSFTVDRLGIRRSMLANWPEALGTSAGRDLPKDACRHATITTSRHRSFRNRAETQAQL